MRHFENMEKQLLTIAHNGAILSHEILLKQATHFCLVKLQIEIVLT